MSNISDKLREFPELLILIDNPTEEDLLKIIYSDRTINDPFSAESQNIIENIPDNSITDRVAIQAMCLISKVNYNEDGGTTARRIWEVKFLSHVANDDLLKLLKINNFNIKLFSKIHNPDEVLIDSYLNHLTRPGVSGSSPEPYTLIMNLLPNNIKGKLSDSQQNRLLDYIKGLIMVNYDKKDAYKYWDDRLRPFITNNLIWLKYRLYSGLGDYKDGEEYQEGK